MGEQRQRTRTEVVDLPEKLKVQVIIMSLDLSITYREISEYLKSKGFEVSKSAIGRYQHDNDIQRHWMTQGLISSG